MSPALGWTPEGDGYTGHKLLLLEAKVATAHIIPHWGEVLEMRLKGAASDLGKQYCRRRDTLLPELGATLQPLASYVVFRLVPKATSPWKPP